MRKELSPNILRRVLVHTGGLITVPYEVNPILLGVQGVVDGVAIFTRVHQQLYSGIPVDLKTVAVVLLITRVMTHTFTYGPRFWDSVKNRSHGKKD